MELEIGTDRKTDRQIQKNRHTDTSTGETVRHEQQPLARSDFEIILDFFHVNKE